MLLTSGICFYIQLILVETTTVTNKVKSKHSDINSVQREVVAHPFAPSHPECINHLLVSNLWLDVMTRWPRLLFSPMKCVMMKVASCMIHYFIHIASLSSLSSSFVAVCWEHWDTNSAGCHNTHLPLMHPYATLNACFL